MRLEAPFWWYRRQGVLASALSPLGRDLWAHGGARSARVEPYRSRLPVICIGNFTVGGGGKTPTAIAVAEVLTGSGRAAVRSSPAAMAARRKGRCWSPGPERGRGRRRAAAAGWRTRRPWSSADRAAGAKLIEGTDATVIVMDDGLSEPQLVKDFILIVVDAAAGLGNGLVMPAGPLRAPLEAQMARADALMVIGDGGKAAALIARVRGPSKPVFKARMAPRQDRRWLGVLPVIGFAGIAGPKKFFATLSQNGARLIGTRSFPDHHRLQRARRRGACSMGAGVERHAGHHREGLGAPARGRGRAALGELRHRSRPFLIAIEFEEVPPAEGSGRRRALTRQVSGGSRGSA